MARVVRIGAAGAPASSRSVSRKWPSCRGSRALRDEVCSMKRARRICASGDWDRDGDLHTEANTYVTSMCVRATLDGESEL
jgi:hypothetical protein